jgi:hypothetical protein
LIGGTGATSVITPMVNTTSIRPTLGTLKATSSRGTVATRPTPATARRADRIPLNAR